jgi:hypothetical protein
MKGRTRWIPRNVNPARKGEYECAVRITSRAPLFLWKLQWDGVGFLVPCPMVVHRWRGMTKKAHDAALKEAK